MMKNKFQYIIACSLLLVYSLNFGSIIHDYLLNSYTTNSINNNATHKHTKKTTSNYYACQEFKYLDTYQQEFDFKTFLIFSNCYNNSFNYYNTSKESDYLKQSGLITPSLTSQKLIFPFHDFV